MIQWIERQASYFDEPDDWGFFRTAWHFYVGLICTLILCIIKR